MVKFMNHSASLPLVVYVAVHTAHAHTTLALFQKIVALTPVRSSLPVKESVMILPDSARTHEALFD